MDLAKKFENCEAADHYLRSPLHSKAASFGVIKSKEGCDFEIEISGTLRCAKKAVTCLLSPVPGDYVAVLTDGSNYFVTDILVRSDPNSANIIESDVPVSISGTSVEIKATEKFNVVSASGLLCLDSLQVMASKLGITADTADSKLKTISHFGDSLKTAVKQSLMRAGSSLRIIEKGDVHKAKNTEISSEKMLSVKAEMTCVSAKKDLRMLGERLHLG